MQGLALRCVWVARQGRDGQRHRARASGVQVSPVTALRYAEYRVEAARDTYAAAQSDYSQNQDDRSWRRFQRATAAFFRAADDQAKAYAAYMASQSVGG